MTRHNYVMLSLFPYFETVSPLIGMIPAATHVVEGQQLTLPCVLLAGNPIPERKWIKNSIVVRRFWINLHSLLHIMRERDFKSCKIVIEMSLF